jgi:transcriptional regulator with XRE-family HTH domain
MPKTTRISSEQARIGARLRAARRALGMTQAQIAAACHISPQAWSGWERGVDNPDPLVLRRAFKTFGISMDWVYAGSLAATGSDLAAKLREEVPHLLMGAEDDLERQKTG